MMTSSVVDFAAEVLDLFWIELVMVTFAMVGYFLFFGGLDRQKGVEKSAKGPELDVNEPVEGVAKDIQVKYGAKDYQSVVDLWNEVKTQKIGSVCLYTIVDAMVKVGMEATQVVAEIRAGLEASESLRDPAVVNALLDTMVKSRDFQLLEAFLCMLPELNIHPDARSFEVLLNSHFNTRDYRGVKLLAMKFQKRVMFTKRMYTTLLQAVVKLGELDDVLVVLRGATKVMELSDLSAQTILHLGLLACRHGRLSELTSELGGADNVQIPTETLNAVLEELMKQKDQSVCKSLRALTQAWKIPLDAQTYLLLIKGESADGNAVRELVDQMTNSDVQLTEKVALALFSACGKLRDVSLATEVYTTLKTQASSPLAGPGHAVFAALVKVYQQCEEYGLACALYEKDMTEAGVHPDGALSSVLMHCAVQGGNNELAQSLFKTSPSDVGKHMTMIRACGRDSNLAGAMEVFEQLQASGVEMNSLMYNCLLDACVQCGDLDTALKHFEEMKRLEVVDVVSSNTLMKAYLQRGEIRKARGLMSDMNELGIQANKVTYNELLSALVSIKDRRGMWQLLSEMKKNGVTPNSVSCSIILKSLNSNSHPTDIDRAMELMEEIEDEMDEVLFSSVIEACIRIKRLDVLSSRLQRYAAKGGLAGLSAPTYGSMIKAYGQARDVERVWELWREMRGRSVKPTAITLGCMVDALVKNGLVDEAFELIHEINRDRSCQDTVNTVTYSTILKGYSQAKQPDRVHVVYAEMRELGIECNTITYNTMIDANARTGRMDHVEELLEDMATFQVEADIITYSTAVKGYCMAGDVDRAFKVLDSMLKAGTHEPDEIMYNSLLDGCAKQHRVDDALKLLERMKKSNVAPSNFTLSILVKLLGRSRQLNKAFTMVEEICKEYGFQANIHVYTCLLQACIHNRQIHRALKLHDSMITEAYVQPDSKTYTALVRGCLQTGVLEKAAVLVRVAYGLPGAETMARPTYAPGLEPRVLEEVMGSLSTNPVAERLAVPLLADLRSVGVHVEQHVYSRAVQNSMSRPGRMSGNPVQAAFSDCRSGQRARRGRN